MKVAVIKYNAGNIRSVDYALKRLGVEAVITSDKEVLKAADKVIFPGVGEAETTMLHLKESGMDRFIKELRQPVLGICLGMQLMCRFSEEGNVDCLGIFDTDVKRFAPRKHEEKVPHMGWNIIDGKCVRLSQGDYGSKKVYNENPVEVAKEFEANGIRRLHVVDLDGAASHHVVNYRTLDLIASRTSLIIDFGGGLKSDEDLIIAFENGAQMVTGGSIAVRNPDLFCRWIDRYGSGKIILGADVKDRRIAVNGWKDESTCELFPFLKDYTQKGIEKVICTDISCDGMLAGPSLDLYKEILAEHPTLYLIASGGVSSITDIEALHEAGVPAVIFGKALYEGRITLKELQAFL